MKKEHLYWLLQLGGWSAYALVNSLIGPKATGEELTLASFILILAESFYFLIITHTFRNVIIHREWLKLRIVKVTPRVLFSTLGIGFFIYLLRIATAYALNIFDADLYSTESLIGIPLTNTFIVLLWSILYFMYHYFERFNISLKYEAAVNEMLLNQLRAQLNPHFMFNALNNIRALIDENPVKSKTAITQLSNILRNSLAADKKRFTSFEDELNIVKDYLDLESIRYEERLSTSIEIDPNSGKFNIPPMMIQTLVENGIKHGISKLKDGGKLSIKTIVRNSYLKIQIRNSGHLTNGVMGSGSGFGLKNTRERLKLLYGDQASFKIKNEGMNTVLTEIVIPQSI